ncbi:MAG: hypothetical protein P4L46_19405 [Fimbriimonas sp.]|nr:hypothetical protein [Fimbriimonas sp.]
MTHISKIAAVAIIAVGMLGLAASASAERIYYLVGMRHVYRIGADKYYHASDRRQIEQDYADEVSADNAHYQYQISHGADPAAESDQLSSALHDLALERERRLGSLYEQCDWVRSEHSCFNISVDGPYQVIAVDYHRHVNVDVWDDCVCYAPWPGYVCEGPTPYGWGYGVAYAPGVFINVYHGWYGGWVGFGSPAFVGFCGFGGPIVCAGLSINIGFGGGGGGYYYNPGLGGYYHRGPSYFAHDLFRGGYIASHRDPRAFTAGRAGYMAGAAAIRSARAAGYAGGIRAGARSTFISAAGRGGMAPARAGYNHGFGAARMGGGAGSFGRRAGSVGGLSHSAMGAGSRSTAGSFAHRTGTPRASGYAHSAIGGSFRSGNRTAGHGGSFSSTGRQRGGSGYSSSMRGRSGSSSTSGANSHRSTSGHSFNGSRGFGGGSSSFGGGARRSGGGHSGGGRSGGGRFGGGSRSIGGSHSFGGGGHSGGGHFGGGSRSIGGSHSFGGGGHSGGGHSGGGRSSGGHSGGKGRHGG